MTTASTPMLSIACDGVHAIIAPQGAGIHGLQIGDRVVMPPDTEWARSRWFSGHTLAPWPNRIREGTWRFEEQVLTAPVNDGLGNALHGLAFDREFTVVDRSADSVTLELMLGDDEVYPFEVRVRVRYAVDAQGLTCTFTALNLSQQRVPFGIGTHPYFPFDGDCTITINAAHAFEVDDRLIPTGRLLDLASWRARSGEPIPMRTFAADDCFTDLERDADERAHTYITYPDGGVTDVWQDRGMPHTVIFTTREFEWSNGGTMAVAIEPQTVPTNAFNSGNDLTWLATGEETMVCWGVAVASRGLPRKESSL